MTSYEKQKEGMRRAIAYKPCPRRCLFCGGADHCLDYHTSFIVSPLYRGFSFFFMLIMNEDLDGVECGFILLVARSRELMIVMYNKSSAVIAVVESMREGREGEER